MHSQREVKIFSDGACKGNPGPGGWGAIVRTPENEVELKGAEVHTTNNRMEMMAVIMAVESLPSPSIVHVTTDSQYVKNGITLWMINWKRNGWRTADKKPVKNIDLWQRLDSAVVQHKVHWHWVKGHSGHVENERVDQLANQAIDGMLSSGKK